MLLEKFWPLKGWTEEDFKTEEVEPGMPEAPEPTPSKEQRSGGLTRSGIIYRAP